MADDGRRDWFVFLESGRPAPRGTPEEQAALNAMQRGHIDNFKRLHGEKKLFAAGPLRDPSGVKRGIVVVRARTMEELRSYFEPDDYVRLGHMTLNATPAVVRRALVSEGIPDGIEEVRIVLVPRGSDEAAAAALQTRLRGLLEQGTVAAWYTLDSGPLAEVLFARTTDSAGLQAAFAGLGDAAAGTQVWGQWLGPRVVPGERR